MIRPEIRAGLSRWSEVLSGFGIAIMGLFGLQMRGAFFQGLAALAVLAGLGLAVIGWRRLRFRREGAAPGIVHVVEGQISYFGPETGGFIAVRDLVELHLAEHGQLWRLVSSDDTRLDIPVAAQGAEQLYDSFAMLPGLSIPLLLAALDAPDPPATSALWLHPARQGKHLRLR